MSSIRLWTISGKVVVEFAPQQSREERHAFQQAFHVRIGGRTAEHGRQRRVHLGELHRQFAEVLQLLLVVVVDHG